MKKGKVNYVKNQLEIDCSAYRQFCRPRSQNINSLNIFLFILLLFFFFSFTFFLIYNYSCCFNRLSKLSLNPNTVHGLLIFTILNNTIMIITFNAFKAYLFIFRSKVTKYVFDLFFCKIISACFIISDVKVFL